MELEVRYGEEGRHVFLGDKRKREEEREGGMERWRRKTLGGHTE